MLANAMHIRSIVSSCMYVSEIMIDLHAELSRMYYNQPEEIDQVHSGVEYVDSDVHSGVEYVDSDVHSDVEYVDSDSDVEDIPKQTTRKGMHTQLFICISYTMSQYKASAEIISIF